MAARLHSLYPGKEARKITAIWLIWSLSLCTQNPCAGQSFRVVKKLLVTCMVRQPGIVGVDSKGNEIPRSDTVWTAYALTTAGRVSWICGWVQGFQYDLTGQRAGTSHLQVGIDSRNHHPITLQAPAGQFLWEIRLTPSEKKKATPSFWKEKGILLECAVKGKIFYKKADEIIMLKSIPSS